MYFFVGAIVKMYFFRDQFGKSIFREQFRKCIFCKGTIGVLTECSGNGVELKNWMLEQLVNNKCCSSI